MFFQVKIIDTNTHHTCDQSTVSHRAALQSGGHLVKLDDDHFRYVANLIKDRPNINTNDLIIQDEPGSVRF